MVQQQLGGPRLWRTPSGGGFGGTASLSASSLLSGTGSGRVGSVRRTSGSSATAGSDGDAPTQRFLNLGQRHAALYTCPECAMVYARGRAEDDDLHRRHHRIVLLGIHLDHVPPALCLETDIDTAAVLVVASDSPKAVQRKVRPVARAGHDAKRGAASSLSRTDARAAGWPTERAAGPADQATELLAVVNAQLGAAAQAPAQLLEGRKVGSPADAAGPHPRR